MGQYFIVDIFCYVIFECFLVSSFGYFMYKVWFLEYFIYNRLVNLVFLVYGIIFVIFLLIVCEVLYSCVDKDVVGICIEVVVFFDGVLGQDGKVGDVVNVLYSVVECWVVQEEGVESCEQWVVLMVESYF